MNTTETHTTQAPTVPVDTQQWVEGGDEKYRRPSDLDEEEIAEASAQIDAALAIAGRPGDEVLQRRYRARIHERGGKFFLRFATLGVAGYGFAPIVDAVPLLLDSERSPEAAVERKKLRDEEEQIATERAARIARQELAKRRAEEAERAKRLAAWNARSKLERAMLQLGVLSPQHSEVAEAFVALLSIMDQSPEQWETLPQADVDLAPSLAPRLFNVEAKEAARPGHTLVRNMARAGRGLIGGRDIPPGAVREIPAEVMAHSQTRALLARGELVVVEEAVGFIKEEA